MRGLPPMEYLLAWRMAVAKDLLRRHDLGLAEIAERVGYGSASTFSTAFSRQVGRPPGRYARDVLPAPQGRFVNVRTPGRSDNSPTRTRRPHRWRRSPSS